MQLHGRPCFIQETRSFSRLPWVCHKIDVRSCRMLVLLVRYVSWKVNVSIVVWEKHPDHACKCLLGKMRMQVLFPTLSQTAVTKFVRAIIHFFFDEFGIMYPVVLGGSIFFWIQFKFIRVQNAYPQHHNFFCTLAPKFSHKKAAKRSRYRRTVHRERSKESNLSTSFFSSLIFSTVLTPQTFILALGAGAAAAPLLALRQPMSRLLSQSASFSPLQSD